MNEVSSTAQMPTSAFAEAVLLLSLGAEFVTSSLHARELVSQRVKPYPRAPLCPPARRLRLPSKQLSRDSHAAMARSFQRVVPIPRISIQRFDHHNRMIDLARAGELELTGRS